MTNDFAMDLSRYVDLMQAHHEEARRMSEILHQSPLFERRADRMSRCSTVASGLLCPKCKTFHTVRASLCRDRLCPNCGWILARRRAFALMEAIEGVSNIFNPIVLHVVLTIRHTRGDVLSDELDALLSGFQKLIRHKTVSDGRIGYIRSLEVKYNKSGFHPHIHMLLVMDSDYYKHMIKQKDLVKMWRTACGLDYDPVVWIKSAYDKNGNSGLSQAVYECVKYCVKSSEWSNMPKRRLEEAAVAIHSRKLFHVGGKLLSREFNDAMKRQSDISDDSSSNLCKKCGGTRVAVTLNAEGERYDASIQ